MTENLPLAGSDLVAATLDPPAGADHSGQASRICAGCGQELPLGRFTVRAAGGTKRKSRCKDCEAAAARARTAQHRAQGVTAKGKPRSPLLGEARAKAMAAVGVAALALVSAAVLGPLALELLK